MQRRCVAPSPIDVEAGNGVTDERPSASDVAESVERGNLRDRADGLRPLILVGACGAFVAVLRNHAEIVLAHASLFGFALALIEPSSPRPDAEA
jgi:hypothetical protein